MNYRERERKGLWKGDGKVRFNRDKAIAALPEILEALIVARNHLKAYVSGAIPISDVFPRHSASLPLVEAALKKAGIK